MALIRPHAIYWFPFAEDMCIFLNLYVHRLLEEMSVSTYLWREGSKGFILFWVEVGSGLDYAAVQMRSFWLPWFRKFQLGCAGWNYYEKERETAEYLSPSSPRIYVWNKFYIMVGWLRRETTISSVHFKSLGQILVGFSMNL